jgi:hypothetical protein
MADPNPTLGTTNHITDEEKRGLHEQEHAPDRVSPSNGSTEAWLDMTPEEEKRIKRKIDFAIVPYCSLLYLLSEYTTNFAS